MAKLVEFIPNFSEGRNQAVIDQLAAVAKSVPGITLMDVQSDESHNRCVFTLVGSPEGAEEVAFQLCKKAAELIDMRKHEGAHPRMGATDVIPFVPVKDVTVPELVELTKRLGKRIYDELGIPSFLYEDSATSPDRVNLGTSNLEIANKIAKIVRGSSGGFKYCKAIGVMLEDRNLAQVSMNMVNYEGTPLYRVFELIRIEAERYGVPIIGTEVVGLTPAKALVDCAEYYLKVENFDYHKQVLENHLIG